MQVEHELCSRLRIGDKWYGRGDKVMLDEDEAIVFVSRGFAKPTMAKQQVGEREKVPAAEVGLITKQQQPEDEAAQQPTGSSNGKSRSKGR